MPLDEAVTHPSMMIWNQMSVDLPKITVVTVVRNAEALIEETIQSTLAQNYPNIEYVVVDGGSNDGTQQIIQNYSDLIACYVSEPDQGIYDAMNKGARLASGDWVIYMNAGDCFYSPNSLSQLESALRSHADVIFAGIAEILVDELETRVYRKMPRPVENIWYQMPTSHQATLVRLKHIQSYQFNTCYRWCADHDMLLRMYRDSKAFLCEDVLLSKFDCSSEGNHRDPALYIRERWNLSQGSVPLYQRAIRYGQEWVHCTVWGKVVRLLKVVMPRSTILHLRRVRGTAGD